MNMGKRALIGCSLFIFFFSSSLFSDELIGISPFINQRVGQSNNWLGFYIRDRVESGLRANKEWAFLGYDVIRLWQYKSNPSTPITQRTTVQIRGSFQQVLQLGVLDLEIVRVNGSSKESERFEVQFEEVSLEEVLDELILKVGRWISRDFSMAGRAPFPGVRERGVREAFQMKEMLYMPGALPEIGSVLRFQDVLKKNPRLNGIGDLTESMIIVSRGLGEVEGRSLLNKAGSILRRALLRQPKNPRLLSLLAEYYFLTEQPSSWVRKTAKEALVIDEQNSLASLLLLLIAKPTSEAFTSRREGLERVNPWIFPKSGHNRIHFQKGILKRMLAERL